jgi:hypothetical protein
MGKKGGLPVMAEGGNGFAVKNLQEDDRINALLFRASWIRIWLDPDPEGQKLPIK